MMIQLLTGIRESTRERIVDLERGESFQVPAIIMLRSVVDSGHGILQDSSINMLFQGCLAILIQLFLGQGSLL